MSIREQMREKRTLILAKSIYLKKGVDKIKIWYYNRLRCVRLLRRQIIIQTDCGQMRTAVNVFICS